LILRAGGYIFGCEIGRKAFQFLFIRQMRLKPFEVVAITRLCGERKMLAPNHFRKSGHGFFGVHSAILKFEPAVVY
jgi:hypothetical protein